MNKIYGISIFVMLIFLSGCTSEQTVNSGNVDEWLKQIDELKAENSTLKEQLAEANKANEFYIKQLESPAYSDYGVITAKKINDLPKTLYKEKTFDIDNDGETENIELFVTAEKMENGSFAWDDGHYWVLMVKDNEYRYPLFDNFVQLGSVDFTIAQFEDKSGIVMIMTSHGNKYIQKFIYDEEQNGYVKETFYKKENMNNFYNGPAANGFFQEAHTLLNVAFAEIGHVLETIDDVDLQERDTRYAILDHISFKLSRANFLFAAVGDLNNDLYVNLDHLYRFIDKMVIYAPTEEQLHLLNDIYHIYEEANDLQPINPEDNTLNQGWIDNITKIEELIIKHS